MHALETTSLEVPLCHRETAPESIRPASPDSKEEAAWGDVDIAFELLPPQEQPG